MNQCVMSWVTLRGILLQFGSSCGLTSGPSVVKTTGREQKGGLHRSFTSNDHQQFNLFLTLVVCFGVVLILCFQEAYYSDF